MRNCSATLRQCRTAYSQQLSLSPLRPLRRPLFSRIPEAKPPSRCYNRSFQTSPVCFSSRQFSYRISASYTGKGTRYDPETNLFIFDPSSEAQQLPGSTVKGKKGRPDSGHDAFFVSRVGKSGGVAFGVADGVGGYVDSGIDPADFSHGLCNYMAIAAHNFPDKFPCESLKPQDLLQAGYYQVVHDKSVEGGGSTACVATAQPDGTLEVANLGDSGFIQLRLNAVHHYSNPQTHAFNAPYQLSTVPPKILAQIAAFGGNTPFADLPQDSTVTTHQLRHGDVLVFGTDGVWDNLSSQDTLNIVSQYMIGLGGWKETPEGVQVSTRLNAFTKPGGISESKQNGLHVTRNRGPTRTEQRPLQALLAIAIAREAKAASLNPKRDGPFAKEVQKHYPKENWHGGKVDDICVIVVIAVEEQRQSPSI